MDEQQLESAATSAGDKLRTFHEGLTTDEQSVLAAALHQIAAGATGSAEDATGYVGPQLIGVAIAQQLALRELANQVLEVFGLSWSERR